MTVNAWKPEKHIKTPEPSGCKMPGHDCWLSELESSERCVVVCACGRMHICMFKLGSGDQTKLGPLVLN